MNQRSRLTTGFETKPAQWRKLLESEPRPEEISAAQARLNRLEEETRYLERLEEQLSVFSSCSGVVTTEHLKEKAGQYFDQGDLICTIENATVLEIRLTVAEQDLSRVRFGQPATHKGSSFCKLSSLKNPTIYKLVGQFLLSS